MERPSRGISQDRFDRKKYYVSIENLTEVVEYGTTSLEQLRKEVLDWFDFLKEAYQSGKMNHAEQGTLVRATPRMFNLNPELVTEWITSQSSSPEKP